MFNARTGMKLLIALLAVGMVGLAGASNMAFKYNGQILQRSTGRCSVATTTACSLDTHCPTGQTCNGEQANFTCVGVQCATPVSLGFQSQFEGARLSAICALNTNFGFVSQTGFCTGTLPTNTVCFPERLDSLESRNCAAAPTVGQDPPFQPTMGLRILLRSTYTGPDFSQVFVSADRPGTQVQVRHNAANLGSCVGVQCATVAALPLHTTARRLSDICAESPRFAFVSQAQACTGTLPTNTVCFPERLDSLGTRNCAAAPTVGQDPVVIVGRPVRILLKAASATGGATGDFLWSPAHF